MSENEKIDQSILSKFQIIKKLGSSPDIVTVDIDLEELERSKQNYHYIDLS